MPQYMVALVTDLPDQGETVHIEIGPITANNKQAAERQFALTLYMAWFKFYHFAIGTHKDYNPEIIATEI